MKTEFKEEWSYLNNYQMDAVLDESSACVVNANVGSGKTTVLTAKILYLHYEKDIPLEDMAVLTFTNKAAGEIINRLRKKEPDLSAEQVRGFGTFHSVALYLLKNRLDIGQVGWSREFTVMSPDEEAELAAQVIAAHKLRIKYKNRLKKRLEQEYQGYLQGKECSRYKDDLFKLYPLLEAEKKQQNKMSFSDLLRVSAKLLIGKGNPKENLFARQEKNTEGTGAESEKELPEVWHPSWIIVDEVQDSDALQIEFLEAMKGKDTKLFAVGDPNQVIYSWRGTGENMFYLLKHRFEAKELSLPVNYRSSASILEAANRFLQSGPGITSSREEGNRIVVRHHYDPFQEAEYLAEKIRTLHDQGRKYGGIAVFYRLQKQSEILENVFDRYQIPYEVSVRKTIKDIPVLDWLVKVLRFSVNPADEQTGIEVLADPRYGEKCTKAKAKKIISEQKRESSLLYQRMLEFTEQGKWKERESFNEAGLPETGELFAYWGFKEALHPTASSYQEDEMLVLRFLERLCRYCREKGACLIDGTREFVNRSALYGVNVLGGDGETDMEGVNALSGDEETGMEGVNALSGDEETGMEGVNALSGDGERGMDGTAESSRSRDSVRLMTLHASKGLEFETVFLIGMNQGLIPLRSQSFEQEEEERRLFFVGITRAKDELELSYYTSPGEPGVSGEYSRYLRMLPPHLLEWEERRDEEEKRSNLQQLRREVQEQIREKKEKEKQEEEKQEKEKTVLRRARHPKYGEGLLVSEDELMVEIEFEGYGRKQFLKAFGEVVIES